MAMKRDEATARFARAISTANKTYLNRLKAIALEELRLSQEEIAMREKRAKNRADQREQWEREERLKRAEVQASHESYRRQKELSATDFDDLSSNAALLLNHAFPSLKDPSLTIDGKKALFKTILENGIPLEKLTTFSKQSALPFMDLDDWARRHGVPVIQIPSIT